MTAVEWLKSNLETFGDPEVCTIRWEDLDSLMLQAKQREKDQIIKAYDNAVWFAPGEQYYNETYGKE